MQPFTFVSGRGAVLDRDNVDTDVIIRIERLTTIAPEELGQFAFESWRFKQDGSEDPSFILNELPFREAPILIGQRNFGCGSSREGAVWALAGRGIRCVIAETFGEIFQANCFQNGVLPVRLAPPLLDKVTKSCRQGDSVTVDLVAGCIRLASGDMVPFEIDPLRRAALLEGLDDIARTRKIDSKIQAWQQSDKQRRPWVWQNRR